MSAPPTFFQRFLLPGFAFKAVIIGGGYATGRELVEFFMPSGPQGGLAGMALAMGIWSLVCVVTFLFARMTHSHDYRSFFLRLLGPAWVLFEVAYLLFIALILSVFGAAAGEIGAALFGAPEMVGSICLMAGIAVAVAFGSRGVEGLFKYVTFFLYAVYAVFLVLALSSFGDRIFAAFATPQPMDGWMGAGVTYASYNLVGAVVILPVVRHMTSRRDAVIAGALCGPLAMAPAMLFFVCMAAYYPQIGAQALPSNYLLERLNLPAFQIVFQLMIFSALLESGAGSIHAINERVSSALAARGRSAPRGLRAALALALLVISIFVAAQFGLVELIARGYRLLAGLFLAIYILPLLTYGAWRLWTRRGRPPQETEVSVALSRP